MNICSVRAGEATSPHSAAPLTRPPLHMPPVLGGPGGLCPEVTGSSYPVGWRTELPLSFNNLINNILFLFVYTKSPYCSVNYCHVLMSFELGLRIFSRTSLIGEHILFQIWFVEQVGLLIAMPPRSRCCCLGCPARDSFLAWGVLALCGRALLQVAGMFSRGDYL